VSEYARKRDFARTPEPRDDKRPKKPRFVVHEHHARRLHWDLRLEHDGALMSWAVPNGIPQDPRENRLAVHVEDHPLSYIDFEGEIPAGSYGAGRISIWDEGIYEREKLEDGKLVVVFHGERLRGRYALFRTGEEKDWMIHRMDPPPHPREAMPEHITPMLASSGPVPDEEDQWAFELKWDGVRAIAYLRPGRVRIESRNLNDVSGRYPELRALGRQLGMREAVLDGEIVAFEEHGRPSFSHLQPRMHQTSQSAIKRLARSTPVTYVIFDVLYLDGQSTMALPYRERRALVERLDLNGSAWQTPANHLGDGRDFLAVTAEHGLEGVIAKRLDSPYRPGERGGEWLKVKNTNRQELVIGGWLEGKGNRTGQIGALLMGYHEEQAERALRYAGRVGTGFSRSELERLGAQLGARRRRTSPFAKHGVQPPKDAHFVKPDLVAEIEFSHWTPDRILRHSSYRGLRTDKRAAEVWLEMPTAPPASSASPSSSTAPSSASPSSVSPSRASPSLPPKDERRKRARDSSAGRGERSRDGPYEILRETKRHTEIEAQGRKLRLSNRDKVMYPSVGYTKGQLVDYYAAIAPVLLPQLAGRPLTLKRYPDGVDGEHFYEKRCPAHKPEWVQTAGIWSERHTEQIDYCLVEDLPTLIWVANLASIELHTSLSPASDMDTPTALVFDLDPGPPAGLRDCCKVALEIRAMFEAFDLRTVVKSSGSKGLQVYLPLNTPVSYAQTKPFSRAVAELLEHRHPELVVSSMAKSLRPGRVLVDWSQNDPHKTTVCVYSLRARERPKISTPLAWEEVERGSRRRSEPQLSAEPDTLPKRLERHGDLFAALHDLRQELPDLSIDEDDTSR